MASIGGYPVHDYGMGQIGSGLVNSLEKRYNLDQNNLWNAINMSLQTGGGSIPFTPRQQKMLGGMGGQYNQMLKQRQQQMQQKQQFQNMQMELDVVSRLSGQLAWLVQNDDMLPLTTKNNMYSFIAKIMKNTLKVDVDLTGISDAVQLKKKADAAFIEKYTGEGSVIESFTKNPTESGFMNSMMAIDKLEENIKGANFDAVKMAVKQIWDKKSQKQKETSKQKRQAYFQDPAKLVDDTRQFYNTQLNLYRDEDGFVRPEYREKAQNISKAMQQDMQRIKRGETPQWLQTQISTQNAGAGIGGNMPYKQAPGPEANKPLTEEVVRALMNETNGDKELAQQLAIERGYIF